MPEDLTAAEHAALQERLADLLGPREPDAAARELARHVEGCRSCRDRLERLRRVHALLADAGAPPVPSARLGERVAAIPLRGQPAVPNRSARRSWMAAGLVAAALIAAALIVLGRPAGEQEPRFAPPLPLEPRDAGVAVAVAMGQQGGGQLPLQIIASGLTPGERYSLWLAGERGEILVETFRPDKVGECQVFVTAPAGEWTRAVVRADDGPGDLVIASSAI